MQTVQLRNVLGVSLLLNVLVGHVGELWPVSRVRLQLLMKANLDLDLDSLGLWILSTVRNST